MTNRSDRDGTPLDLPAARSLALENRSSEEVHFALPVGSGALIAAVLSLATCYSGIIGNAIFGVRGLVFNPPIQAVLMWGLTVLRRSIDCPKLR